MGTGHALSAATRRKMIIYISSNEPEEPNGIG